VRLEVKVPVGQGPEVLVARLGRAALLVLGLAVLQARAVSLVPAV
jgi:hypothetical protein